MGDNGGGHKALVWMLNYSMSGHMNTSCDMETSPAGIHYGFLQPWSQHNNWAYASQPWFLGKKTERIYGDYARLRYSLLPYLYSMAHWGHQTSMPILRPMPLAYPDDPALADNCSQYMLGDSLLVAAFTDHVRLPAGRWINYWTGEEHIGPMEMTCTYPANRAGPLFIKAGAILPYWPAMDYTGEKAVETIKLQVYPEGTSEFTLFEDDGESLEYLKGAIARTPMRCSVVQNGLLVRIEPRSGNYEGMPARRTYDICIHTARPASVTLNGNKVDWKYEPETGSVCLAATEDPSRKTPITLAIAK
jgi:alpha-glucosidase (family GH31 glycosyl hydrolase)